MLVLTRKAGETIRIGDDIFVTVEWVDGNRVSLGIEAPRDVKILRGEIDDRRTKAEPNWEARQ